MQRKLTQLLLAHLTKKTHSIIIGARQVGKTTVMKGIFQHLKSEGKPAWYITFEDPAILRAVDEHPENIFRYAAHPDTTVDDGIIYMLIDEVQYARDPSNLLKYLYDTYAGKLKIIATSSSAFYIDQSFKDSLAGRKQIFHLHPLDFEEYLEFKGANHLLADYKLIRSQPSYISSHALEYRSQAEEYMTFGAYPAVVMAEDIKEKTELLRELRNSFLKKDILESQVEDEAKFYDLATLLASQIGNLVNRHELSNTLKMADKTIERYLFILQKCFHIELVSPFTENKRKEITRMPKVYFNDCGLRNSMLNNFQPINERMDKGALMENFIFQHLRTKYEPDQLHFWRTADGNEVDFVLQDTLTTGHALEIKWETTAYKESKYKKFRESYPNFPLKPVGMDFATPGNWALKNIPID